MHVLLCLLRSPSLLNVDRLPSRGPLSLGIAALLPALPLGLVALACNRPVRQPSSTPPDLQRIVFAPVAGTSFQEFEGRSGNQRFILAGPDEPRRPTAWLGPLQIQDLQTGTSCQSTVSLVTAVYAGAGGDVSVVIAHSGSLTYAHLLDPRSCKQKHPAIEEVRVGERSEEHTSELQSQSNIVCRLLLEKKKTHTGSSVGRSSSCLARLEITTPQGAEQINRPDARIGWEGIGLMQFVVVVPAF